MPRYSRSEFYKTTNQAANGAIDWGVIVDIDLGGDVGVHLIAVDDDEAIELLRRAADHIEKHKVT